MHPDAWACKRVRRGGLEHWCEQAAPERVYPFAGPSTSRNTPTTRSETGRAPERGSCTDLVSVQADAAPVRECSQERAAQMPIETPKKPTDAELAKSRKVADVRIAKQRGGKDDHAPKKKT